MSPEDTPPSDGAPVIIKKYGNRRLYDTRQSKYITLEDLAGIVQAGATVQVVDSTTARDLTRQVLMQVILEKQESVDVVPVELLHAVLRVQGTLEQAPLASYLSAMTGQFVDRGNVWAKQIVDLMGSFPMSGLSGFPGSNPKPEEPPLEKPPPEEPTPDDAEPSPELHNVRNRMDALLNRMKKS